MGATGASELVVRDGSEMIGCDNDACAIGWYHLKCLGKKRAPKGSWFCPNCTAAKKAEASTADNPTSKQAGRKRKALVVSL
jgi:hypothetical protein